MDERRRPVPARGNAWIREIAAWLARVGIRPNVVSAASVVLSALAAVCVLAGVEQQARDRVALLFTAALLLELRLLANLLDGLVAVEGGLSSPSGEIWNELPDRFSDAIALVAAGYAVGLPLIGPALGWAAALAAVITAYVRALGLSAGASAHFEGPMAKQRRIETLALGCVAAAFEPAWGWNGQTLAIALAIILIGSLITIARRTRGIINELHAKPRRG